MGKEEKDTKNSKRSFWPNPPLSYSFSLCLSHMDPTLQSVKPKFQIPTCLSVSTSLLFIFQNQIIFIHTWVFSLFVFPLVIIALKWLHSIMFVSAPFSKINWHLLFLHLLLPVVKVCMEVSRNDGPQKSQIEDGCEWMVLWGIQIWVCFFNRVLLFVSRNCYSC